MNLTCESTIATVETRITRTITRFLGVDAKDNSLETILYLPAEGARTRRLRRLNWKMLISIQPRRDIPFRASSLSNSLFPTLPPSLPRLSTFRPHPHLWRALYSSRVRSPSFWGTKLNLAGGNSSLSTILPVERTNGRTMTSQAGSISQKSM